MGATSFSANSRTISRTWTCSSVRNGLGAPAVAPSRLLCGWVLVGFTSAGRVRWAGQEAIDGESAESRLSATGSPLRDLAADVVDQLARRSAGPEQTADAVRLERMSVRWGDDTAPGDKDVREAAIPQERRDPWEQRHVRARVERQPDGGHVLLERRVDDHIPR